MLWTIKNKGQKCDRHLTTNWLGGFSCRTNLKILIESLTKEFSVLVFYIFYINLLMFILQSYSWCPAQLEPAIWISAISWCYHRICILVVHTCYVDLNICWFSCSAWFWLASANDWYIGHLFISLRIIDSFDWFVFFNGHFV